MKCALPYISQIASLQTSHCMLCTKNKHRLSWHVAIDFRGAKSPRPLLGLHHCLSTRKCQTSIPKWSKIPALTNMDESIMILESGGFLKFGVPPVIIHVVGFFILSQPCWGSPNPCSSRACPQWSAACHPSCLGTSPCQADAPWVLLLYAGPA